MISPKSTSKVGASMTIMLVVPTVSNAFPDIKVMMTLDFSLMVRSCRLHHFFKTRKTAASVLRHSIPKVKFLVVDVAETAIPIWGWNSESGEVPGIFLAETI